MENNGEKDTGESLIEAKWIKYVSKDKFHTIVYNKKTYPNKKNKKIFLSKIDFIKYKRNILKLKINKIIEYIDFEIWLFFHWKKIIKEIGRAHV
jgi:hypothetical protein